MTSFACIIWRYSETSTFASCFRQPVAFPLIAGTNRESYLAGDMEVILPIKDFMHWEEAFRPGIVRVGGISAEKDQVVANNPSPTSFGARILKREGLVRNSKVKQIPPNPAPSVDLFSAEVLDIVTEGQIDRVGDAVCFIGRGVLIKIMTAFKRSRGSFKFRYGFSLRITRVVIGMEERFVVEDDGAGWCMDPAYGHAVAEAVTTPAPGCPLRAYHYEYNLFKGLTCLGAILLRYEVDCVEDCNSSENQFSDCNYTQVEIKSHQTKYPEDVEYNAYCVLAGRTFGLLVISHNYGVIKNTVRRSREVIELKHGINFYRDLSYVDNLLAEVFNKMKVNGSFTSKLCHSPKDLDFVKLILQ